MFKNERRTALQVLSALIAVLALIASITGIAYPSIYKPIVLDRDMPFVFAQDVITVAAAAALAIITIFGKRGSIRLDILRSGIVAYLFYAYGQYSIGTLYNYFYFLYIAVFGLSIFFFIYAFTAIEYERLEFTMPKPLRIIIAAYCAAMPAIFAPQWIIDIVRCIQTNSRPEADSMFSFNTAVYIQDLSFVLPVCTMASVMIFQKKNLGLILGGILQVKGFTLLVFVAMGFIFQPLLFHQNADPVNMVLYSAVSSVFLILAVLFFIFIEAKKPGNNCGVRR
jgi:hypothetical protein